MKKIWYIFPAVGAGCNYLLLLIVAGLFSQSENKDIVTTISSPSSVLPIIFWGALSGGFFALVHYFFIVNKEKMSTVKIWNIYCLAGMVYCIFDRVVEGSNLLDPIGIILTGVFSGTFFLIAYYFFIRNP